MFIPELDVCELDSGTSHLVAEGNGSASLKLILKFHLGSFLLLGHLSVFRPYKCRLNGGLLLLRGSLGHQNKIFHLVSNQSKQHSTATMKKT